MKYFLLTTFYLLCPVLVLYLSGRYRAIRQIGTVVICYLLGLVLGNAGILPARHPGPEAIQVVGNGGSFTAAGVYQVQDTINTVMILLAVPLLLFSLDIRSWVRMAGKTFLSMVLGLASVLVMIVVGYFLLRGVIPQIWKISGMLVGVYSGGTPNLAAINMALDVDPDTYIITHTYDLVVGALVLLFLITGARRFFLMFMKPYEASEHKSPKASAATLSRQFESYRDIFSKSVFLPLLAALGCSAAITGISFLVSKGIILLAAGLGLSGHSDTLFMTLMILSVTSLGIVASLMPRINRIRMTFQGGMYLILIFCLVVASMADLRIFSMESWPILVYILLAVPGSLLLHALLSRLFGIDVDNFLIISVALSMSPPFVPVVAAALKNRSVIIPGMIIGIIGYAIGNYLGVLVAFILH